MKLSGSRLPLTFAIAALVVAANIVGGVPSPAADGPAAASAEIREVSLPVAEVRRLEGYKIEPVNPLKDVPEFTPAQRAALEKRVRDGLGPVIGDIQKMEELPKPPTGMPWGVPRGRWLFWHVTAEHGKATVGFEARGALRAHIQTDEERTLTGDGQELAEALKGILEKLWGGTPKNEPARLTAGRTLQDFIDWWGPDGRCSAPEATISANVHRNKVIGGVGVVSYGPATIQVQTPSSFEEWGKLTTEAVGRKHGGATERQATARVVLYFERLAVEQKAGDRHLWGPSPAPGLEGAKIHDAYSSGGSWTVTLELARGQFLNAGIWGNSLHVSSYSGARARMPADGWRYTPLDIPVAAVREWPEYREAQAAAQKAKQTLEDLWSLGRREPERILKAIAPPLAGLAPKFVPAPAFSTDTALLLACDADGAQHRMRLIRDGAAVKPAYLGLELPATGKEPVWDDQDGWLTFASATLMAAFEEEPKGTLRVESHLAPAQPAGGRGRPRGQLQPFWSFRWTPEWRGLPLPENYGTSFGIGSHGKERLGLTCNRCLPKAELEKALAGLAKCEIKCDGRRALAVAVRNAGALIPDENIEQCRAEAKLWLMPTLRLRNEAQYARYADTAVLDDSLPVVPVWRVAISMGDPRRAITAYVHAATGALMRLSLDVAPVECKSGG